MTRTNREMVQIFFLIPAPLLPFSSSFFFFFFLMSGGCGDGSNIGERVAKEESFQEVQFQWRWFRCSPWHVHRCTCQALSRQSVLQVINKILGLESSEILDGLLALMLLFPFILICLGFWVYCYDRFQRGVKRKPMASTKKLRKAVRWFLFFYTSLYLFMTS